MTKLALYQLWLWVTVRSNTNRSMRTRTGFNWPKIWSKMRALVNSTGTDLCNTRHIQNLQTATRKVRNITKKTRPFSADAYKSSAIPNFTKIRPVGAALITFGRTCRRDETLFVTPSQEWPFTAQTGVERLWSSSIDCVWRGSEPAFNLHIS